MKQIIISLLAGLLAITACKKNSKDDTPHQGSGKGVVTPVGTPEETAKAEKVIGTAGGTLASLDGKVSVNIPAGALTADQTISIQRITNNNPMGIRSGYRITPHNVQFAKEVTLTFPYTAADVSNSIPEALGIAYQDNEGVWKEIVGATLDKTNKTVSVKTTHFSDWTIFEQFFMLIDHDTVPVNGVAKLELFTHEDLLDADDAREKPIGQREVFSDAFVKSWSLTGEGKLTNVGASAVYTAPATLPLGPNPVAITVSMDLKRKGQFLIFSYITVANDGEISVRVDGGEWFTMEAKPAEKGSNNIYTLADKNGILQNRTIYIAWEGGAGAHPFKEPFAAQGTQVAYSIIRGNSYGCYYYTNDNIKKSGGGVTITSMGEPNGYIEGTFSIAPAGYAGGTKTAQVEGKFKARRTW